MGAILFTWSEFFTYMGILCFAYYLAIVVIYFRKDILKYAVQGNPTVNNNGEKKEIETEQNNFLEEPENTKATNDPVLYNMTLDLLEEIKPVISAIANDGIEKELAIDAIARKTRSYPQLKGTPFEHAVNNHIVQELKQLSSIVITEYEVQECWAS